MIKTHKELASHIAGKNILLLNSFGKDSILCLDWLSNYAVCGKIVSLNFNFMAPHPDDKRYELYLKRKFPNVEFFTSPNTNEINKILEGIYQFPIEKYNFYNNLEYSAIESGKMFADFKKEFACDYICSGESRSESFARAVNFHKKGILQGDEIFPLGMMSKEQIYSLLKGRGIKLHPQYKFNKSTLDRPTYYKMRSTFILDPEYKKAVLQVFPLLELDEYRYERLLK